MRRGAPQPARAGRMQEFIHSFERAEKAGKTLPQMRGRFARGHKITMPEQIGQRDNSRSHGAILVCALRPGDTFFRINPNGKTHAAYGLFINSTCASIGSPLRSTLTFTVSPGLCARNAYVKS